MAHPIILVESYARYRLTLAGLLETLEGEIKEQVKVLPAEGPEEAQEHFDKGVQLLITHIHFTDDRGDKDYAAAAALCRQARQKIGADLPIIGLTRSLLGEDVLDLLKKYRFPEDIELYSLDYGRARDLVAMVRAKLAVSTT